MRRSNLTIPAGGFVIAIVGVMTVAVGAFAAESVVGSRNSGVTTASHVGFAHSTRPPAQSATSASPANSARPNPQRNATNPAGVAAPVTAARSMSPAQLAGQRVIYSYNGLTPPAGLLTLIAHGQAAGVIFFSDNVGGRGHLAAVVRQLLQAAAKSTDPARAYPLLLMTDQEGGLVRRLPGQPYLSEKQVGASAHPWAAAAAAGAGAAANLRSYGLNVNLAPVLDVYRQAGNFIDQYGRSFSSNPKKVGKLGELYATAEQHGRIAATVKHFPGLGAAATKQNTDLGPVTLNLTRYQIRHIDELPYAAAIAAKVKLVMLSWAVYPALDKKYPAGLSAAIVQQELRQNLKFTGVTITDALGAGALKPFGSIGNRATLAAKAGMDLLLCSGQKVSEGGAAAASLASDYQHRSASYRIAFQAVVNQILALRKSLPS